MNHKAYKLLSLAQWQEMREMDLPIPPFPSQHYQGWVEEWDMTSYEIEHFKSKVNIVDVIGGDCTLSPDGSRLCGAHCVHSSKSGRSLKVYPDQQSFFCFNCHSGGDVIEYVQNRDNCTFVDALRWLSDKFNVPLPTWTHEQQVEHERRQSEKEIVSNIMLDAFKFYHDTMTDDNKAYLCSRGLFNETIDTKLLGYAPGGRALYEALKENYSDEELLLSGLFYQRKSGKGVAKDFYQDRYVFPYWHQKKIVYSIGRTLDPNVEEYKKYIKQLTYKDNHPYVSKTVQNVIYNADSVRKFKRGIITEGIIDALHIKQVQEELEASVISPITTRFSKNDVDRLVELTQHWDTVFIINDTEKNKSGERGALDSAERLFEAGRDVRLVTLPLPEDKDKIDIADFLNVPPDQKTSRIEELKQLMESAPDFIEWKINEATELPEREKTKAAREIFGMLTNIDDRLELEHYAELMQEQKLVKGKRLFWGALKDAKIELAKERKQEQMKFLEKESPELFLKAQIEQIRKNKYAKAFEIKKDVSGVVIDEMREHGRFYRTPTDKYYWFSKDVKRLCQIGDNFFEQLVNDRYGLNRTEAEYEYLIADLETEAGRRGKESEIYRFAHYDKENHVLYIDKNDFQMFKLDGMNIDLVPNGTDGVLFVTDPQNEPFELKGIGGEEYLRPLIIDPTNFAEGAHVNLNPDEQKYLFQIWLYTLPFEELQPTKPIQVFIGPQGSGKTTRQRIVGQLFFGRRFNVQSINDEDDFIATITHNYFAVFDNVDTYQKWLNDRLAQVATGQRIEKRELYTTNRLVRYYPRCFLSLNSREPKFKRPDVVDRLLLFRVQRLEKFSSEARLLGKIDKYRNELWSEMLIDLNQIVAALKADDEPFLSQHRMADWAELAWRIAKTQDAGDYFIELLEKMDREQSEFVLEDNPVYQCLEGLLLEKDKLVDMSSAELYKLFKEYAEKDDIDFTFKSARSLGMHLRNILPDLREFFEIAEDKKNNCWVYSFKHKSEK